MCDFVVASQRVSPCLKVSRKKSEIDEDVRMREASFNEIAMYMVGPGASLTRLPAFLAT